MSTRTSRPPGLSTRATSASASRRLGHMMEHEHERRERRAGRRRSAAPRDRRGGARRCRGRCRRFRAACSIAADASTAMTRATNGASAALTWPVPQPRSPTTQSRVEPGRRAPPDGTDRRTARRAARSHWPADDEKNSCDLVRRSASAALQAPLILGGRRRGADLLAHQLPQPPRGGVEIVARHRVEVARALGARRRPSRCRRAPSDAG